MSKVTRADVEDFLFHEAALLDEWKLNEWQALLTDDAHYLIPPYDLLVGDDKSSLFIIADDRERIRQRIIRVLDPNCHAEAPKSRTQRIIGNVRILSQDGDEIVVAANYICYRYRRYERVGQYVGDGKFKPLATEFDGKKFNSPNDLVVAADGSVYFTDPPYGLPKGQKAEQAFHGVYKLATDGKVYTCLFGTDGFDLRGLLREGAGDGAIENAIAAIWRARADRYSEIRTANTAQAPRVEMSYIGG
jgi:p-cumate 2,3-dioxygenase beta subunit